MFVDDAERGELRIFTPEVELPLAGHPLVGVGVAAARARDSTCRCCGRPPARCRCGFDGGLVHVVGQPGVGAAVRVPRSSDSPAEVDALDGAPEGYGLVGVWAWIDEPAGLIRERVFVPEAGVEEDEATGSAALPPHAHSSGARSRSAREGAR